MESNANYRPLNDYALIGDCHGVALISRTGSVDWAAMPRIDDHASFARLLDYRKGGFWAITPCDADVKVHRYYEPGTMILVTEFETASGKVRLRDCMSMPQLGPEPGEDLHIRQIEGLSGRVELRYVLAPRFDYGLVSPCIRAHSSADGLYVAWGSKHGLVIYAEAPLKIREQQDLSGTFSVDSGARLLFSIRTMPPEELENPAFDPPESTAMLSDNLDRTRQCWRKWSQQGKPEVCHDEQTLRSALVLRALTVEKTGAVAAAATTSLPEHLGGERNWDYRFSWVRDSVFTVRVLHELGFCREADRFADFIERSTAGNADQIQAVFGVDGGRLLVENELEELDGYCGSRPVRTGNAAMSQAQHDAYGELLELAWARHSFGTPITPQRWGFLKDTVETACQRWDKRDYGIWEVRSEPQHFVFSMALCWRAVDRGIALAEHYGFEAPLTRWRAVLKDIRAAIETRGYDEHQGIFRQAFDSDYLDSSLLLLPWFGFIDYRDPRMVRTTEAIRRGLDDQGLLRRYNSPDGLSGHEGAFLASSFWLVECLAHQGEKALARRYYARAAACANDVGLFPEEFDTQRNIWLGNLPQGLTHLGQIMAYQALRETGCFEATPASPHP